MGRVVNCTGRSLYCRRRNPFTRGWVDPGANPNLLEKSWSSCLAGESTCRWRGNCEDCELRSNINYGSSPSLWLLGRAIQIFTRLAGSIIVRWTEIYVPETLHLVLISATTKFANSFVAFLLNLCSKCLYNVTAACSSSCHSWACSPPPVCSYRVSRQLTS
jgi:hypothetical protein